MNSIRMSVQMKWAILIGVVFCGGFDISNKYTKLKRNFCISAERSQKVNNDANIGRVYEYKGDGIPDMVKLFGIKQDRPEKLKRTKPSGEQKEKFTDKDKSARKGSSAPPQDNIDDLERQVLSKYGSSSIKEALEEDGDDEFIVTSSRTASKKTFVGGFGQSPLQVNGDNLDSGTQKSRISESDISVSASKKPVVLGRLRRTDESVSLTEKDETSGLNAKGAKAKIQVKPLYSQDKTENDLTDFDDGVFESDSGVDVESTKLPKSRGPSNVQLPGFRLRPPPGPSPEEKARQEKKTKEIQVKEDAKKLRRDANRAEEKSAFYAFDFGESATPSDATKDSHNSASGSEVNADNIFTDLTFEEIGVSNPAILRNLKAMQLAIPTKIQAQAVPVLQAGQDAVLQAQTGSGKSLAFLLPLVDVVDPKLNKVQALIIAPSRELVTQLGIVADKLFADSGLRAQTLIGGANVKFQIRRLREDRPQILIATPGRLAELVFGLEIVRLGMVRAVVIDEVDNLIREPYRGELQTILDATPLLSRRHTRSRDIGTTAVETRTNEEAAESDMGLEEIMQEDEEVEDFQDETAFAGASAAASVGSNANAKTLMCLASATGQHADVTAFAERYLRPGWKFLAVESASLLPASITHGLISTPRMRALEMLRKFLNAEPSVKSAIIFVNEPHRVEIVCEKLLEMGMVAAPLHGDSSKDDRKEVLARLRDGRLRLVVSTELAARGIDIPDLTHVVNFELPTDAQHYVHRAGRCGRAGRKGLVMNFANPDTKFVIRRFGKQLRVKILDCELREGRVFLKRK